MYTKKEREQYNRDREIVCKELGISKADYNYFRLQGSYLHKIYENNCNGYYEDEEQYFNDCKVYEDKANARAKKLGLYIFYQTDPRGATIYLSREPIADNDYNRFGSHCIY